MSFKDKLNDLTERCRSLADEANKLDNKNLRDVLLLGAARFKQAAEHPDAERVDADDDQRNLPYDTNAPLNSGGNELFAAGDPGAKLQNEEAQRRAAFPEPGTFDQAAKSPVPAGQQFNAGAEPFPGSVNDPNRPTPVEGEGHRPGDPAVSFQDQNPDFRAPNNVLLNDDGTVKQAPNSLGAAPDNRDSEKGAG